MTPVRYGVYLANLDPTVGREITKTRPVVIVSMDAMNQFAGTVEASHLVFIREVSCRCRASQEMRWITPIG